MVERSTLRITWFAVIIAATLFAAPAFACFVPGKIDAMMIARSEIVAKVELEYITSATVEGAPHFSTDSALVLHFRTIETYKGQDQAKWLVAWRTSLQDFMLDYASKYLRTEANFIAGIMPPRNTKDREDNPGLMGGWVTDGAGVEYYELQWVPCQYYPALLPSTKRTERDVLAIIRAEN